MIQKNIWAGVAVSLSMSIAMGLSPLMAAPATVAEIATYAGADRQSVLEAGAKREGTLLIYATGTQADPLYEAFGKKYPFIKVESFKGDSPTVTRRVLEEYAASTYLVDTLDLAVAGLRPMMESGLLQPYRSPEQSKFVPTAIEPKGHWTIDYESYVGLGYNSKLISEAEAPKTYEDLLDPKWRGKMAVPGSSTLGNEYAGAALPIRGEGTCEGSRCRPTTKKPTSTAKIAAGTRNFHMTNSSLVLAAPDLVALRLWHDSDDRSHRQYHRAP